MPGKSGELRNLVPEKLSYLERIFLVPNKDIHKNYWETLIMFSINYTFSPALEGYHTTWEVCTVLLPILG